MGDVSTMIRNGQNPIIFLINNGGYTIEVEIHDGPYNVIKNWNYTGLVDALHNGEGKCWTAKAKTEEDIVEAIKTSLGPKKSYLSGAPESRQQMAGRQILSRQALKRRAIGKIICGSCLRCFLFCRISSYISEFDFS